MKKVFGKLSLSKEIISSLDKRELQNIRGGLTTSYLGCSGITCCDDDGDGGDGGITNTATADHQSCGLSIACESCNTEGFTSEVKGC